MGALLQALRLEQLVLALAAAAEPLLQLGLDAVDGRASAGLAGRDVVARRDRWPTLSRLAQRLARAAGSISGIALDLVAEELDADGALVLVGREDLDHVAAHAEGAAVEVDVVALVLDVDERAQQRVARGTRSPTLERSSMPW